MPLPLLQTFAEPPPACWISVHKWQLSVRYVLLELRVELLVLRVRSYAPSVDFAALRMHFYAPYD